MRILVLNSAQGKYPTGAEGWVQTTLHAVGELASDETVFLCSTEPAPWSLTLWLAGRTSSRIGCIVKAADDSAGNREYARITGDFGLRGERTHPLFLGAEPAEPANHPKDSWQMRDRRALTLADEVYPVSIRPGGRLHHMLGESGFRGKVRNEFRIPWSQNGFIPRYTLTGRSWRRLPAGRWLVHWTRACPGPWPGESSVEYFRDVIAHPETYVRNAGATLSRIVREGTIRGSCRHMPANLPAVAFTALSPGDAVALMRWRKRYVRYTFEPWGIAIQREELVRRGAREVTYTNGRPDGPLTETFFSHAEGADGHWREEREWRLPGNLTLGDIPPDSVRIIVPGELAAEKFGPEMETRFPVHLLFRD